MATLKNTTINDTGFLTIPSGTIAQRPTSPSAGMFRYNTDLKVNEYYDGTSWVNTTQISIVTSGLVLHLDAAQPNSYSGSGTTWFDLSGNGYNGTMSNVTYSALNSGNMVFNGTNSSVSLSNPLNQSNLSQVWTVSAWVKNTNKSIQTLVGGLNSGVHLDWFNSGTLLYLNGGANDYYTYGSSINNTGWCLITFRFRNSDGARTIYKNTTNISTYGPNATSTPSGQSATFTIGSGGGFMEGNIAQICIYNRYITDSEIQQNYLALKDRFGL